VNLDEFKKVDKVALDKHLSICVSDEATHSTSKYKLIRGEGAEYRYDAQVKEVV
jgi:hypothetical protein